MSLVIRLVGLGVLVAAGLAMWAYRTAAARRRLAEVDAGTRCVGCSGSDTRVEGDEVRCADCGYVASLSSLRAQKVSAGELATLMRPDDQGGGGPF
jgi:hypothetical protein